MNPTERTDLHDRICAAITRRSLVMFEYGDLVRVVEPHRFGINSAGHAMLSGWLRAGYSRSDPAGGWRNYLFDEIHSLQVLDAPFAGTRPGYAAHDARMREVYAQLTPTAMEAALEAPYVVREPESHPSPSATATEQASHPSPAERAISGDGTVPPGPP